MTVIEPSIQTGDPVLMRSINRVHVMEAIREHGPISRVEISRATTLSGATVSDITGALLEEGLILAKRIKPSGPGRPRMMLQVNADAGLVVGVKLSMHQLTLSLTNFKGEPLRAEGVPLIAGRDTIAADADRVADEIRRFLSRERLCLNEIAGIGIGLPGFIENTTGACHWSPIFGHSPPSFTAMLEERLGAAVMAENDVNLVALAERWFGHGRGVDSFMVVTSEHGVGMGLYLNGALYRGRNGMGVEFGHMTHAAGGVPCRCGRRGCIEAYSADYAIVAQAAEIIDLPPLDDGLAVNNAIREVTQRAAAGDQRLVALFDQAGRVLGQGVANLINILTPTKVIVTGEGVRAGDMLIAPMQDAIAAGVPPFLYETTPVICHEWGDEVWAQGAAALVLQARFAGRGAPARSAVGR